MKVSIIIPVFNASEFIGKALLSCLSQTYTDIQIIVVDDGSTDNSVTVVETFKNKKCDLLLISKKNEGVVNARNTGVKHACGEYVFFLDADDHLPPHAIEDLVSAAKTNGCDIICGDFTVLDNATGGVSTIEYARCGTNSSADFFDWIVENRVGYLWGKLIRRRFLISEALFLPDDLVYCEDLIQMLQLSIKADFVAYTGSTVYNYVQHDKSVCGSTVPFTALADRYKKICGALLSLIENKKIPNSVAVKNMYCFYGALYFWFSGGVKDSELWHLKQYLRERQVRRAIKDDSKKRYWFLLFSFLCPCVFSMAYQRFYASFR